MVALSAEHRLGVFYAALFATVGAGAPFLALWLDARGVSAAMIGTVVAAPSVVMVLTTVALGRWADAIGDRRAALVRLAVGALLAHVALAFASGTVSILLLWTAGGVLLHAIMPITDAFALRTTARRGSDWARVRLAGSVGFVLALLGAGALYERFGIDTFLAVLIGGGALRLLAARGLPRGPDTGAVTLAADGPGTNRLATHAPRASGEDAPAAGVLGTDDPRAVLSTAQETVRRSPPSVIARPASSTTVERGSTSATIGTVDALRHPGVRLTIAGAAMINASHAFFYTFGLLVWTRAGIGETTGGVLWSAGVVAEMLVMWRFRAIAARLSARVCLLVAGAAAVLRWTLTWSEPSVAMLFAAQCLHALTFGLGYLAGASFVARRAGEADAARGQAWLSTAAVATMAASTWVAGLLYARVGVAAYGAMALLALGGTALVAASYRSGLGRDVRRSP